MKQPKILLKMAGTDMTFNALFNSTSVLIDCQMGYVTDAVPLSDHRKTQNFGDVRTPKAICLMFIRSKVAVGPEQDLATHPENIAGCELIL